ncbi:MAG: SdpI family protein [Bacteroidetes bacterium]|nr:SdpI family protein [Bacteroidota bacterium]
MKNSVQHFLACFIALIPLIYLGIIWDHLPATVPTHFDIYGKPNDYSSRSSLWLIMGFLSLISIGIYFLVFYINKIDPKRANQGVPSGMRNIARGTTVFISLLGILMLRSSLHPEQIDNIRFVPTLIGLLFLFLGNYLYRVRPNYFIGFKLPWTLSSNYNWKKTHQLAGILWFLGGLFIAILSFWNFLLDRLFLPIMLIIVIVPIVYSFSLFIRRNDIPEYFDEENKREENS